MASHARSGRAPAVAPAAAAASRAAAVLVRIGPALYAGALVGFGTLCLGTAAPVPGLEPLPESVPAPQVWAYLSGLALVGGGAAAAVAGRRSGRGALVALGSLFVGWAALLHLPRLLEHPTNGSIWTAAFEAAALGGAAWALSQPPTPTAAPADGFRRSPLATAGRLAFGVALVVFGVLHLVYRDFVALLVPAWIPATLFWAVFTGAAHLAAGLALLAGVLARPAALWIGAMFGSWVLIVHAPRVLQKPTDPKEWSSLLVALGMCGGAWLLAGRLPARARRPGGTRLVPRSRASHSPPRGGPGQ